MYSVGARHTVRTVPFGTVWHGGAGAPGVSPTSGYLDIGNTGKATVFSSGTTSISSAYTGDGREARLDALLVQPEVEQLLLRGESGAQGMLRSWASVRRTQMVNLGVASPVTAYSYNREGELTAVRIGRAGRVAALIEPYGFTYLLSP